MVLLFREKKPNTRPKLCATITAPPRPLSRAPRQKLPKCKKKPTRRAHSPHSRARDAKHQGVGDDRVAAIAPPQVRVGGLHGLQERDLRSGTSARVTHAWVGVRGTRTRSGGREDAVWTHGARAAAHVRVDGVARELEVGEHVARADERRLPRLGHAHDLDHPRLRALHLGRLHLNGGAAWGGGVWEKRGWRRGVGVWGRARGARGEGWERGGRLPTPPPVGRALGPGARAGAAGLGR